MYRGKSIAVVVPAYNEEKQIAGVIDSMPEWVDHIVIVDDQSKDRTVDVVRNYVSDRVVLLEHAVNQGVGGAIATGYCWARDHAIDLAAVMAGDGQMAPEELGRVLDPLVEDQADYCKGNRFFTGKAWDAMPKVRFFGNAGLSLLSKFVSGYWHVSDVPCGYTACNLETLNSIDFDKMYRRYGMPVSMLVLANMENLRVCEVPISPLYNVGEQSKLKVRKVTFTISALLIRLFFQRMWWKYVVRDFHPLVIFYLVGFILSATGGLLCLTLLFRNWRIIDFLYSPMPVGWIILAAVALISGLQFILFGSWFDMDYNKPNCVILKHRGRTSAKPEQVTTSA